MKIFVLLGPSAAGKSALMDYLLLNDNDFIAPIISFTTRPMKAGEKVGREYYYISKETYTDYCVKGKILEEITYLDHHYGITYDEIEKVKQAGKNGILIMNTAGLRILKEKLGPQNIVSIFIYRDLKDIFDTIRSESGDETQKLNRIELAKQELKEISSSDHVVYNISSLADAYRQLITIIRREINAKPETTVIKPGQRYRHFNDAEVEIIDLAYYTEDYRPLVIYRDFVTGKAYARPYEIFCGYKYLSREKRTVKRFELIEYE